MNGDIDALIVGSTEWHILNILKRNHGAKDCPHEGNCLNDRQALEATMQLLSEARIKEVKPSLRCREDERELQ
jgi:hypothetical protein